MKKVYAVWFREPEDANDQIAGIALNWKRAETMALNFEFHQKAAGKDVEVGVKSFQHGQLECEDRWGKEEFEE